MIEGRDHLLDDRGRGAPPELMRLLRSIFDGTGTSEALFAAQRIKDGVHRLCLQAAGAERSVVVKRFDPDIARRNEMVVTRWLPAAGLGDAGPVLLGVAAEAGGRRVWHVYEDLGEITLEDRATDAAHVEEAVDLVARVHTRFAEHALLGEVRLWGGDLGMQFYRASVRDALRALEALAPPAARLEDRHEAVRRRLLDVLERLLREEPRRAALVAEHGGPETLLHGDLWRKNIFVTAGGDGRLRARLIDWDHAAVGPAAYDLSTLLYRFTPEARGFVLERYREAVAPAGWRLPDARVLDSLFETAELSRIANRVIWPALAILDGDARWGPEALAEIETWFERLEPVFPVKAMTEGGRR